MRIPHERCIGLIIDVQDRLFPHIHEFQALAAKLKVLAEGLQVLDVPVVLTEQYRKGLGPTIKVLRDALPSIEPLEKASFSCCDDTAIMNAVTAAGRSYVILAGIEAHICLLQTSMDLIERNYTPVLVADAVSSRTPFDRDVAIERVRSAGGVVTTVESLLFEFCRVSGTETFKQISRLVK
ncbi:MAG: hydrolase [Spirochaeta sp.]|nr:hydrolase [Spirochaeta sp.]